jgi:hypothetical protein
MKATVMIENQNTMMALMPALTSIAYMSKSEGGMNWLLLLAMLLPPLWPLLSQIQGKIPFHRIPVCGRRKREIIYEFSSRLDLRHWADNPDGIVRAFSAVLWDWNKNNKVVNCKSLMEENVNPHRWNDDNDDHDVRQRPYLVDNPFERFWNSDNPNIQYIMWIETIPERDGPARMICHLRIEFLDKSCTPKAVTTHISNIRKEARRLKEAIVQKPKVLVSVEPTSGNKGSDDSGIEFMDYEFATTSSFDNFFCEEAKIVKSDLEHFIHRKAEYERIGRPWTYTVLNHGPPGVGKTKLVKAIAKMTERTLIVLNLKHIPNAMALYNVFHSSVLDGEHLPHYKRLYYVPEVDTQAFSTLKARKGASVPAENEIVTVEASSGSTTVAKLATTPPTPSISLGDILNVLDGVPERHGHIIIFDTNHLAELDPALTRPGRVDRILTWGKLGAGSARAFVENYYDDELPADIEFADDIYTGAELQTLVYKYKTLPEFLATMKRDTEKIEAYAPI